MKLDKNKNILIIGLGVIGGSYAMALSKKGYKVFCITKDEQDILYAREKRIILGGSTTPDQDLIANADFVILAIYPEDAVEWIRENRDSLQDGALITDVSGVKGSVVTPIQELLSERNEFVAAHPMAGREQSGVAFADDRVFCGANFLITPTEKNTEDGIATVSFLAKELGFRQISVLSPEEHDKMIAFLSQLTHCIAVSLMNANQTPGLEKYTGDSFRDLTRIAKINDNLWSKLFLANKEPLLAEMDAFLEEFLKLKNYLSQNDVDGMREMMRISTARRSLFDKPTKAPTK